MDRSVLKSMSDADLRARAKKLGVQKSETLKKDELIDAILDASDNTSKNAPSAQKVEKTSVKSDDKAVSDNSVKSDKSVKVVVDGEKTAVKADDKKSSASKSDAAVKAEKSAADEKKSAAELDDAESADAEKIDDETLAAIAREIALIDADETLSEAEKAAKKDALKAAIAAGKVVKKEVEAVEPPPVEPDSIFIDHGAILPQYVPGTCLFALVRDPGTLFVYWNASFESDEGWILTAYDMSGSVLQSFSTPARRNGRGYFRVPTARVARVTLVPANPARAAEFRLESKIRIAQQLGIAQPRPRFDERWVDFQNHEVIYEAPAPGHAPAFQDVYQSMTAPAFTGGGYDRSVEHSGGQNPSGSMSSRFGSLNGPGSSDTLVGSSDRIVRH